MSNELCTGVLYDCALPTSTRPQKSWKGFTTRPLSKIANAPNAVATVTMRTRESRSAIHARGTAPSTRAMPPKLAMPMSVVSLIFRVFWISGASTAMARRSISSAIAMSGRMSIMARPPLRAASPSDICAAPTPGRRSSGRTLAAERAACSVWRLASSSSTVATSAAGSSSSSALSSTFPPKDPASALARSPSRP